MKTLFIILLFVHGALHLLGFEPFYIRQQKGNVPRTPWTERVAWLVVAILFMVTAVLVIMKKDWWWLTSIVSLIASQVLIIRNWKSARAGTLINIIILLLAITGFAMWSFEKKYSSATKCIHTETELTLLTGDDIAHLPAPVRKYLEVSGCIGRPKVQNFNVRFSGRIRADENGSWMPFTSEQYNNVIDPARHFFMKAVMNHFPVYGYHCYQNRHAYMDIRLLSLFPVQFQSGAQMDTSETVTFFNDMCCLAPATLINPEITWIEQDSMHAGARFRNGGIEVGATLFFNAEGRLIDFVSDDRYALIANRVEKRRWSTPIGKHTDFNGFILPGYAETMYELPSGQFCYGEFRVEDITYNIQHR